MNEYNNDILNTFPIVLQKNFEYLLLNQRIGLFPTEVTHIKPSKSCKLGSNFFHYGYLINIPYAGTQLAWEIVFMPNHLRAAPDFYFNDDTFIMAEDLEVVTRHVPALSNWDIEDPKSLTLVLKQFLELYKLQQMAKLAKENMFANLYADYIYLTESPSHAEAVEVFIESGNVHFVVSLPFDAASLSQYVQTDGEILNPGQDFVLLKVSFLKMRSYRPMLYLSPKLEQCLGTSKSFNLPVFGKDSKLTDYVGKVTNLLNDQMKRKGEHHALKKEYMNIAYTIFRKSLTEFDSKHFLSFVALCQVDGYNCKVHIQIGPNFPGEKPTVVLQSIYCFHCSKPCMDTVDSYPYSPRWKPKEMLQKLLGQLQEAIPKFQKHKH